MDETKLQKKEKEKVSVELEIKEKISENVTLFCKMYISKEIKNVDEDSIIKKAYGILNANYLVHASQINKNYPVCKFEKLTNRDQLGMQATKDALSLYFTKSKDPEFMALYIVISYSLGAEVENEASLTAPMVLALIRLLVQLESLSENLKKLIKLIATFVFTTFKIKFTVDFVSIAPIPDDVEF